MLLNTLNFTENTMKKILSSLKDGSEVSRFASFF